MKIYKALFFGTPDFAILPLNALAKLSFINLLAVVTQPDKPVGKKQTITPPPVKNFALNKNLQLWQPEKINTSEFESKLKKLSPDLIIIVAYGKIIPKNLIDIPKFGWLNLHASLLPKYRGASPIQAAILHGEEKTGVTLMKINEGLDTGDIISQKVVSITYTENFATLHDKLSETSAELLKKDLKKYLLGDLKTHPQGDSPTPVTKTISKESGRINWNNDAEQIDRQIRAYNPWPGTYTFWDKKRIKIIDAEINMLPSNIEPGRIFVHGDKYYVGTITNAIKLNKIQLAGKKTMNIKDFIQGHPEFIKTKLK